MNPKLIHDPKRRRMRVACFVSGSGSNARRIIERSRQPDSLYDVVLMFTDVRDSRKKKNGEKRCKAKDIADEHGIGYECEDIRDFYKEKGVPRKDLSVRPEFDEKAIKKINPYDVDLICNAGYMTIMTPPILDAYSGRIINVHPADLSIMDGPERKYVGIHVVEEAILAGETEIRATTHIVRKKVDHGEILVISESVPVQLPEGVTVEALSEEKKLLKQIVNDHQSKLKERGDWAIYPLTVQLIAEGKFSLANDQIYFDGEPAPNGVRLPRD
ncbi:MAG: formyltransferase family protein [Candidatus Bathyarchaeota archaeon]|nr:formyltransferase family protein [Candidatus Bathyarchaeota archaeon]